MKFCLISLDFRRYPLEHCFRTAARLGYDGVEIWGGRPHAWPYDMGADDVKALRELKQTFHLDLPMYTPAALGMGVCLCATSVQEREDALRYFQRAIDVAADLEIARVLLVADHPGFDADARVSWAYLVDNAQTLADYAAPKGVSLCFEPLTPTESPVLVTADDCVALLADVNRDNVCTMLDVIPPTIMGEPLSSYFTKLGDKVAHVHLANSDGRTDAHLALDDGILPIPDVLRFLHEEAPDRYVTVELYSASARDPDLVAANTMRFIKTWTAGFDR